MIYTAVLEYLQSTFCGHKYYAFNNISSENVCLCCPTILRFDHLPIPTHSASKLHFYYYGNCNCNCNLFTFRGSVQDYKIHRDMEIVTFA